jgi:hypothetical protein
VASIEARIDILLSGMAELNKLQSKLDAIQATADQISKQGFDVELGRVSDLGTYSRALKTVNQELEKTTKLTEIPIASLKKSNAEISKTIGLESRLRRERSLVSRYTREFSIETKGLDQSKGQLKDIKDRFDELNNAFGKAFKSKDTGLIRTLRTELSSLVQEQRDWNRTLTGTKKTGVNADFLNEQAAGYREQIDALKARAKVLADNEDIIGRLAAAERNLVTGRSKEGTFLPFADPRLGRQQLSNATKLIQEQEKQQRESKKLADGIAKNALRSPVLGGVNFPGSPKAVEAQRRAQEATLRRSQQGYPVSPILGTASMAGSPRAMQAQERSRAAADRALRAQERAAKAIETAADKALRESQKGYPSSPILGGASIEGSPRWKKAQESAKGKLEAAARASERAADKALSEAQKGYPASPILGAATIEGSPRWKTAQQAAKKKLEAAAKATGAAADKTLQQALESLREARGARASFLGGASPAEAIDQIVREFNTGKAGGAAGGAAGVAGNVTESFTTGLKAGIPQAVSAAITFSQAVIDAFRNKFKARSPAKAIIEEVIIPIVQAFEKLQDFSGRGVSAGKSFASSVMDSITGEVPDVVEKTRQASTAGFMPGERSDLATRLASFAAKLSSKPSLYRRFANLAGEDISSSPAISEAIYRKGYEAGQIVSPRFLPVGERRGLRGTAGIPGGGLEQALRASAFNRASATGAFVGSLPGPARSTSGILDPRGLAFGVPSLPSGRSTGLAGIFDAQVASAQKVTDSVYSMVGKNTFRDFSQRASQITAKSRPGFIDELKTSASMVSASILGKVEARSTTAISKGRSGIAAATELIDDIISLGRTAATATGISARAKQGLKRVAEIIEGSDFDVPNAASSTAATATGISARVKQGLKRVAEIIDGSDFDVPNAASSTQDAGVFSKIKNKFKTAIDFVQDVFSMASRAGGVSGLVGGGGGGPRPPAGGFAGAAGGGGQGGQAQQIASLLGLDALGDISRLSTRELEALSGVFAELRAVLDPTIEGFDRLDNQLRETIGNIGRQVERRDPNADFLTRRFGPRAGRGISEGLIGGAFPLLFGQGIGASAGGLFGGAAGGFAGGGLGFGLSLIGTALGSAFDTLSQAAQDTGKSLNYPIEGFEKLKEAGLFASRQQEQYISRLIEGGQVARAIAEIQTRIVDVVGVQGANDLMDLGDSASVLSKKWAELNFQMQALVAGPVGDFLNLVAKVAGAKIESNAMVGLGERISRLTPEQRKSFQQEAKAFSGPDYVKGAEAILNRIAPQQLKGAKRDPAEEAKASLTRESKKLEAIDISKSLRDTVRQAAREQQDLDKQRADLVRSYEESIGNIRKQIEDEVSRRRFSVLEKENQLLDLQGQNRIKQIELANSKLVAAAGQPGDTEEVTRAAREAASIVAEFTQSQLSAEEEAARLKRDAALDARKFDFEASNFKANIEKEVAKLNIETARQVSQINEGVRRRNEETDTRRFNIEKRIAQLQLANIETDLKIAARTPGLSPEISRNTEIMANIVGGQIEEIENMRPPAKLRRVASVGGAGASTTNFDAIVSEERSAIQALINESLAGIDLDKKLNLQIFQQKIQDLIKSINQPIENIATNIQLEEEKRLRYMELVRQGYTSNVANQIIEIEQLAKIAELSYDRAKASLEAQKAEKGITETRRQQIQDEIDRLDRAKKALPGTADAAKGAVIEGESPRKRIENEISSIQQALNELVNPANQVIAAADAIGGAFSESFKGVISGSMSAQEALANFFQRTADYFLDMAAQIIQKWIVMTILNQALKLFPGGGGPGLSNLDAPATINNPLGDLGNIGGAYAKGGMFGSSITPFAMGGAFTNSIVSSPTLFKFAAGGVMNTGVMGEAGPEAIMPLSKGPGGRLGVDASGAGGGDISVTVNVDAKGTGVEGNQQQGAALGRVISAAVQAEIIKQQRPGGLLTR